MHEPHDPPPAAPAPADPSPAATPPESNVSPPAGAGRWLVVLAAVALVLGPLLAGGLPRERAQWRIAAGLEHWLDGDLSAALAELDAAARLAPDYPRIYELRSEWRTYAGDYSGALEDAERLLELDAANSQAYHLKSEALVYLGRPQQAVETWRKHLQREQDLRGDAEANTLNGLAYYRSLAKVDLDQALADVNKAILRFGPDPAMLDTRGYLRFLKQDYQAALDDLNSAVLGMERLRDEQRTQSKTLIGLGLQDPRAMEWRLKLLDRSVAVLRYHRALVLEALGKQAAADRDYRRIYELGHEPGPQLF